MLWQMETEDFRAGGHHYRLTDAKHQPHREQHRKSSYQTGGRRGKGPEEKSSCYHPIDVKTLYEPTAKELHHGIGPKKGREQNAKL
jgi:hypothetical protein